MVRELVEWSCCHEDDSVWSKWVAFSWSSFFPSCESEEDGGEVQNKGDDDRQYNV